MIAAGPNKISIVPYFLRDRYSVGEEAPAKLDHIPSAIMCNSNSSSKKITEIKELTNHKPKANFRLSHSPA